FEDQIKALVALAKRTPRNGGTAWDDAVVRDKIAQLAIRAEGLKQNARRARVAGLNEHPMRLPLQSKVVMTELTQDIGAVGVEIAGPHASRYLGDPNAPDNGHWPHAYMNSY